MFTLALRVTKLKFSGEAENLKFAVHVLGDSFADPAHIF